MSLTPQQLTAVDTRDFSIVLSSGAGCGKTHVLTQRFLSYLQRDGVRVNQIVAITFTERAARQMRERIRRAIGEMLLKHPEEAIWKQHLDDAEYAEITTIHSFCGNLLRQNAIEAGIDPKFDILEEILSENLRVKSLKESLQTILLDESPIGEDLRELTRIYGWWATTNTIRSLLRDRDSIAHREWSALSPAKIASDWIEVHRWKLLPKWVNYLRSAAPEIVHLMSLFDSIPCSGKDMASRIQTIRDGLDKLATSRNVSELVETITEAAKVGKDRDKAWPDKDIYEIIKTALENFRSRFEKRFEIFTDIEIPPVEKAAEVGQRFIRVASRVAEDYQKLKIESSVLDFQDLLSLTCELLDRNEEVRSRLQKKYRYLLLDEMQDTDPTQMKIIRSLCGVGFEHDKLFAVGDIKQSIYRFRGAEVALFESLRDSVQNQGRLQLTVNFRSQPAILNFVNALCSLRFPDYEPLEPKLEQIYSGECIEFLWSVPDDEEEKENADQQRAREAASIAMRISELLDSKELRVLDREHKGGRTVQPGDIVLLFRSMSNVAIYEAALRDRGLNYYLVGGRAFFAQQEIYDILNALRFLDNPNDKIALAGVLRSPMGCLSDEALLVLGIDGRDLWTSLADEEILKELPKEQLPRAQRIYRLLQQWRLIKDRVAIAVLMNRIIADTAYDAALQFEYLGERKLANLWKLIDIARQFDRSGLFSLAEFIARLNEMVAEQPREEQAATEPEESNVIKIMSIHQAKGLEFPVVFIPDFATRTRGSSMETARWHRELGCLAKPPSEDDPPLFSDFPNLLGNAFDELHDWQEDLRVLYVACTRARDLLIISGAFPSRLPTGTPENIPLPIKMTNSWMIALGERFNLRTGYCFDRDIPLEKLPKIAVREVAPSSISKIKKQNEDTEIVFKGGNFEPVQVEPWPSIVNFETLQKRARGENCPWHFEHPAASSKLSLPAELQKRWTSAIKRNRDVNIVIPWKDSARRPAVKIVVSYLMLEKDGWHAIIEHCQEIAMGLIAIAIKENKSEPLVSVTAINQKRCTSRTYLASEIEIEAMWKELEKGL